MEIRRLEFDVIFALIHDTYGAQLSMDMEYFMSCPKTFRRVTVRPGNQTTNAMITTSHSPYKQISNWFLYQLLYPFFSIYHAALEIKPWSLVCALYLIKDLKRF